MTLRNRIKRAVRDRKLRPEGMAYVFGRVRVMLDQHPEYYERRKGKLQPCVDANIAFLAMNAADEWLAARSLPDVMQAA